MALRDLMPRNTQVGDEASRFARSRIAKDITQMLRHSSVRDVLKNGLGKSSK